MSGIAATLQKVYIRNLAEKNKRIDGRKLNQYRNLEITPNFISKAEGSAMVQLGKTKVLVGVKLDLGEPFKDTPDKGVLITNAELVPLASPEFEPGPPDENSVELARFVDRGIRESEAINLSKLVVKEGETVWIVFIDIHVLDHDGNLIDASAYGAITALLTAKMPKAVINEEKIEVIDEWAPLPIERVPIPVTVGKIGDKLLIDPNLEEENVLDAKICITFEEEGNICAIQKVMGLFTEREIEEAISLAEKKSKKIREEILEITKGGDE